MLRQQLAEGRERIESARGAQVGVPATDDAFEARTVADARGMLPCRACHLTGRDYVLTPWPLK